MSYKKFYLFITCMLPEYEESIIAGIVKMGYKVGPLSACATPMHKISTCSNVLLSLEIQTSLDSQEADMKEFVKKIRSFLMEKKFLFYSVIAMEPSACAWNVGNIKIERSKRTVTKPTNGNLYQLNTGKGPFSKKDPPEEEKKEDDK